MLLELLTPERIAITSEPLSFEQAVRLASEPMLAAGSINESYIQAMVDSLEKNGPYFVLTDYFAMPHARPEDGVSQLDMAMLVCRSEVDVGGQPVRLFAVLAAANPRSHIEAMAQLAKVLWQPNAVERLCAGQTPQEIFECLRELSVGQEEK